jgi:hypothetical protein
MKFYYIFALIQVITAYPMLRSLQSDDGCHLIDDHIDCIINKPYGPKPNDYNSCGDHCTALPTDDTNIVHNGVNYTVTDCFVKNGHVNCKVVN